jgi:hypothetical protein
MKFVLAVVMVVALLGGGVVVAQESPAPPAKAHDPAAWKEFKSDEGHFTVSLPGTPTKRDNTLDTPLGPLATHSFILQTDQAAYYISYSEFPKVGPMTPQDHKEMLDSSRDRVIADGAHLISETELLVGGRTGRELLVEKNGMILLARFVYVNEKLYNVIIGAPVASAFRNGKPSANLADRTEVFHKTATKYFDSFKVTK